MRRRQFCIASFLEGICDLIDVYASPYDLPLMQEWIGARKRHPVVTNVRDREVPRVRIDLPDAIKEYWGCSHGTSG